MFIYTQLGNNGNLFRLEKNPGGTLHNNLEYVI